MIPWLLFVLAIVFYLWTGWLPYMLHVPVVPGMLADRGPADSGEIDSRGCVVPPCSKLWTVQIGLRLPGPGDWPGQQALGPLGSEAPEAEFSLAGSNELSLMTDRTRSPECEW